MAFYTDGVVPWNSLDDNTRAPLASELENGYPCGEADQQLFNWTAGWSIGNIWNMILQSGITPDPDKLLDLARAVQSGKVNYAAAAGTANALTAVLSPVPASLTVGLAINLLITTENTAAATLNLNGTGAVPVRTMSGAALQRGDLQVGAIVRLIYSGTAWLLGGGLAKSEVPIVPTSDVVMYVRTDGNDSNDGGANTSARAFATIQKAIDIVTTRYAVGASFGVRIILGNAGTYAPAINRRYPGELTIEGGGGSYIISSGDISIGVPGSFANRIGRVTLKSLTLANSSTSGTAVSAASLGGFLGLDTISINSLLNNTNYIPVYVVENGVCSVLNQLVVNGGDVTQRLMRTLIHVDTGGVFNGAPGTSPCTIYMAPLSFSAGAVEATLTGVARFANVTISPSGTFSGPRYNVASNGVIDTLGGGANFFPGGSAGTASTGGQYL